MDDEVEAEPGRLCANSSLHLQIAARWKQRKCQGELDPVLPDSRYAHLASHYMKLKEFAALQNQHALTGIRYLSFVFGQDITYIYLLVVLR